jgi:hypothetical protein
MTPSKKQVVKSTPEVKPVAEQPASAPTPATPAAVAAQAQATPSKQQLTIMRLVVAFRERRQIEVKPEQLKQDGKFINVMLGEGWPTIRVGNSGGITVLELKSYTNAFDAAIEGDVRLKKQQEREQKKTTAAAAPAVKPEEKKSQGQKQETAA